MLQDPISDLIIRLKNASAVSHTELFLPYSSLKHEIAKLLQKRGFVKNVDTKEEKGTSKKLHIELYPTAGKTPRIKGVNRISKPSRRVYTKSSEIMPVKGNHGVLVVSTPKGILAGDEARKEKVGGEALFSIW